MLFLVRNFELVKNREKTFLTATVAVADTTLTVKALDSNAWANNDWIIVGEIGSKNAEILQVNGAVSDGTSLTIDNAGSGGARFAHSINEPVYRIDYNQVEISRNTTDSTTGVTVLATNEIQVDDLYTRYEDTSNSTGFGFVRFKNSQGGNFSEYSDGIPYTGYSAKTLGRMIKMVRRHLNEPDFEVITDDDIIEELNEKQRDIAHERLWPFYEDIFSDSTVAYQRDYEIDNDIVVGKIHTITVESQPLAKVSARKFEHLFWDTSRTGEPSHCSIWNNKIRLYPVPATAATSNQLNGAITATATTITLDSTSGFSPSGRATIESEIISYTSTSSTQLLGCERGLEESTAATHADNAAVTERDIVYPGNREPNELTDPNDETKIPDPLVLVYGAGMELAAGKLKDPTLHDRLKLKYDQAISRLRDKFGQKMTSQGYRILDKDEVISESNSFKNPQDYPTGLS